MRIKKGDIIAYDEETFIADEIGMKYIVCHSPDTPHVKRWLKHQQVCKWTPPDPSEMEDHEMKIPLIKGR
ncbi:hypothetical protein P8936_11670 [Edaphobacter paludis]|uniref:Uncharacterized protein n=1 Tax=Edaphobacter paludis TaxID=3035702 RepID=A0AAU7D493_9BACT